MYNTKSSNSIYINKISYRIQLFLANVEDDTMYWYNRYE